MTAKMQANEVVSKEPRVTIENHASRFSCATLKSSGQLCQKRSSVALASLFRHGAILSPLSAANRDNVRSALWGFCAPTSSVSLRPPRASRPTPPSWIPSCQSDYRHRHNLPAGLPTKMPTILPNRSKRPHVSSYVPSSVSTASFPSTPLRITERQLSSTR